jgi:5-methylcytosine-specific restriction endonuclease McrA
MKHKIKTWQTESNAIHYTKEKLFCDLCKKQDNIIYQIGEFFACGDCLKGAFEEYFFIIHPKKEYAYCRMIKDVLFDKRKEIKKEERNKMTLKLRYEILKRDGFKCVLCGKTAKETRLEVDHIIPLCDGGKSVKSNLRTLCFECNRGKGIINGKS